MENRTATAIPPSKYNDFLFTVICEEPGGTQLSVLSALTRVNIDPWEEAARLSAMTGSTAKGRLISILDQVPEHGWSPSQGADIVERLIQRLPSASDEHGSILTRHSDVSGRMLVLLVLCWSVAIAAAAISSYQHASYQHTVNTTEAMSSPHSTATTPMSDAGADTHSRIPTD